jgi:hypothetical protein
MLGWLRRFLGLREYRRDMSREELVVQIDSLLRNWERIKTDRFANFEGTLLEADSLPPRYVARQKNAYDSVIRIISLLKRVRSEAELMGSRRSVREIGKMVNGEEIKNLNEHFRNSMRYHLDIVGRKDSSAPTVRLMSRNRVSRMLDEDKHLR